ncbi:MAG: hypothetical protein NC320_00840 [Clostridium sp.]|nr:hypothetical protein [Clostridium sp.]MCM1546799.1 hypothetical protein [Ruminococcus sp.]
MVFTEKQLEECLTDAGCSKKEKAEILQCYSEHNIQQTIRLLRMHRKVALDTIHTGEKQLGCLDYLVFQLEKESKN